MSFGRKTNTTTGKQSKSKSKTALKPPRDKKPTQAQSAKPDPRVTHDNK